MTLGRHHARRLPPRRQPQKPRPDVKHLLAEICDEACLLQDLAGNILLEGLVTLEDAAGRLPPAVVSALDDEYSSSLVDARAVAAAARHTLADLTAPTHWTRALVAAGLDGRGLHFHDLRHTRNTLTAQSGATLADLMARMGHATTRAASIYLHTTSDRDLAVSAALDRLLPPQPSGT